MNQEANQFTWLFKLMCLFAYWEFFLLTHEIYFVYFSAMSTETEGQTRVDTLQGPPNDTGKTVFFLYYVHRFLITIKILSASIFLD